MVAADTCPPEYVPNTESSQSGIPHDEHKGMYVCPQQTRAFSPQGEEAWHADGGARVMRSHCGNVRRSTRAHRDQSSLNVLAAGAAAVVRRA